MSQPAGARSRSTSGARAPSDRRRSETRAVASVVEERGHGAAGYDVRKRIQISIRHAARPSSDRSGTRTPDARARARSAGPRTPAPRSRRPRPAARSRATKIGVPGRTRNRPAADSLDEAGHERRAGQEAHQRRASAGTTPGRPRNCTSTRSRPRCRSISIATTLVVGEPPANLQRGVERLSDLDRIDAEPVANLPPQPVHLRRSLRPSPRS